MGGAKSLLLKKLRTWRRQKAIELERSNEEFLVVREFSSDKFLQLSESEKSQVAKLWGQLMPINSFKEYEMFKKQYTFDPRFLTHNVYLPIVAHLLNDYNYTKIFEDKGLLGFLTSSKLKFPNCFIRRINADYYTNEMKQISFDEAIEICVKYDKIFIKPSKDTSGGNGSELVDFHNLTLEQRRKQMAEIVNHRTADFVAQECIKQSGVMAQFNESSINTLRITTLLLHGKFSVCSIILRMGRNESKVDNWGAGGIACRVNEDGTVAPYGADIHLNRYDSNGICTFKDKTIPNMASILKAIEQSHRRDFAICKFIGWDVAIDENEDPVILELNSSQPGVIVEQIFTGPIFGDRTQEVIDYCILKADMYKKLG